MRGGSYSLNSVQSLKLPEFCRPVKVKGCRNHNSAIPLTAFHGQGATSLKIVMLIRNGQGTIIELWCVRCAKPALFAEARREGEFTVQDKVKDLLQATQTLVAYIEEHYVFDKLADAGCGLYDTYRSDKFEEVVLAAKRVAQELEEVLQKSD
jgi:hypothetical protein